MPRIEYWSTIDEQGVQKDAAVPVDDFNRVHVDYELWIRLMKKLGFTKMTEERHD